MHRIGETVAQNRRDFCTELVRQLHRTGGTVDRTGEKVVLITVETVAQKR